MADVANPDLELVAVMLVDMRATVDSMKRTITHAQSSVEQFRHVPEKAYLLDIADCLNQLLRESRTVADTTAQASEPLGNLLNRPSDESASPSSGSEK